MIIKNFVELAETEERKLALEIADAGLAAVDTQKVVKETVNLSGDKLRISNEEFRLAEIEHIFVVGVGKCSLSAAGALEEILGSKLTGGTVIDVRSGKLNKIQAISGDHPMPTEKNVSATDEIISLLKNATEKDLVIFIISGGGSTLLCHPENMTCLDEAEILRHLYGAGAGIKKINTLRKHISTARGGFLAKYAYPANAVALIFSDVPGDDLEFIASGPTIRDTTTVKDAKKIVDEFNLAEKAGLKAINLVETPKENKYFENIKNILVVSNKVALAAMAEKAKSNGFRAEIVTATLVGESEDVGLEIVEKLHGEKNKTILLYGGETVVTGHSLGKGGRAQELALSALRILEKDELILALGSDGRDNTDFAGALCDSITKESADKFALVPGEYLRKNMSYYFFEKTGDYVVTGDTGRNVADFVIAIKS